MGENASCEPRADLNYPRNYRMVELRVYHDCPYEYQKELNHLPLNPLNHALFADLPIRAHFDPGDRGSIGRCVSWEEVEALLQRMKQLEPLKEEKVYAVHMGSAVVGEPGSRGLVSSLGEIIPGEYADCAPLVNGLAPVRQSPRGSWAFIGADGSWKTDFIYPAVSYSRGYWVAALSRSAEAETSSGRLFLVPESPGTALASLYAFHDEPKESRPEALVLRWRDFTVEIAQAEDAENLRELIEKYDIPQSAEVSGLIQDPGELLEGFAVELKEEALQEEQSPEEEREEEGIEQPFQVEKPEPEEELRQDEFRSALARRLSSLPEEDSDQGEKLEDIPTGESEEEEAEAEEPSSAEEEREETRKGLLGRKLGSK